MSNIRGLVACHNKLYVRYGVHRIHPFWMGRGIETSSWCTWTVILIEGGNRIEESNLLNILIYITDPCPLNYILSKEHVTVKITLGINKKYCLTLLETMSKNTYALVLNSS